jgi:hypothetical protein
MGQMVSRAGEERGCRVLSAHSGLGLGFLHRKRLGGLGGALGSALWSQFSSVDAELGCVLCQQADAHVQ